MKRYVAFCIYGIIYVAAVDLRILKHEGNDQSVNLALDTVVEFDNKNNGRDIAFLDNVQKFIGKVKTVIVNKNLRRNFNGVDNKKLTDFILSLIQMLLKFEDSNLEDFFTVTTEEFKKYHYKGCKFYELIENYEFRKFLANKLDEMRHTPVDEMRRNLKAFASKFKEERFNANEKELIDYINSLYGEQSIDLFNNVLSSLDDYRLKATRDMNLSKIINAGIRSIVFDYYTELHRNARVALKIKLNEFFEKTIGISSYTTKSVVENKKKIITTKEVTVKPKYVEQYLDIRQSPFKYGREKPLLSSITVSYNSKIVSNIYNPELNYQTTEKDTDIVKPGQRQKVLNSIDFTQPYFEKQRNRINYPISYKFSKKDKKNKRHTHITMQPVRSSIAGHNDKSQRYKFKTMKEPNHVTPKEPEIKNSNFDGTEFNSPDHEVITLKRVEHSTMSEQVFKYRKEQFIHQYSNNITGSRLLRGKPLSDSEIDSKYDVEPTINRNFQQQFETGRDIFRTSHKLTTVDEAVNSFSDDKFVGNVVKIPDDKLRTIDELRINQTIDKKPKPQNDKEKILTKTTENESIEIIALDDLQQIEKITPNIQESSEKLSNRFKSVPERNTEENTNTQRMKYDKLTFMTLYPEFIQKWSTADTHTMKQRNDDVSLKQTTRCINRHTQTPIRKTKTTTNLSYNKRAKNTETPAKPYDRPLPKSNWNRKAKPKKDVRRPEVSDSKRISRLIVREKLKGYMYPSDVTSKVNDKRREDLSSELLNSDDNILTEELDFKTPYRKSKDKVQRDFFIDLNVAQPKKKFKVVTNRREYDPNMKKYLNSKYQKSNKNINRMSNKKLQKTRSTSVESNDSKYYTDVDSYKKSVTIKNLVLHKTQDLSYAESDKKKFKNNVKGKRLRRFNRVDNKFKQNTNQKFNFDINKHKHNLTRKVFIDLHNTEVKHLGVISTTIERYNNMVKNNLVRSNQYYRSDTKKDTRRMINEQDMPTNTDTETDKSNKEYSIRNCRNFFNEYSSTARRKKIYFSYLNDNGKTDGYDLFYNQAIARASKERLNTTIKYLDDTYNTDYISITRKPEDNFLEGRKTDDNYFNNIDHKNILNKSKIINQTGNNNEINKLNTDSENNIDRKEKTTEIVKADGLNDSVINSVKNLHKNNFIRYNNDNDDSLPRNKEEPIEIPYRIIIDNGKFRSADDINKLKEIKQSLVSSKVTENDLNQQRRNSMSNINAADLKEGHKDTVSNIKYSTANFEPIKVATTVEKSTIKVNVDTTNDIDSNKKYITDVPKSVDNTRINSTTAINNFNVTSDTSIIIV